MKKYIILGAVLLAAFYILLSFVFGTVNPELMSIKAKVPAAVCSIGIPLFWALMDYCQEY